jgi:hypothetical protein
MEYKIVILILILIIGLYYCISYNNDKKFDKIEKMTNNIDSQKTACPNMLIEKDGEIVLFNSALPKTQENMKKFKSLDDYINYVQSNDYNIDCPVLYLQYGTDTQNNDLLQIKPSIFENNGGLSFFSSEKIVDPAYYEKNRMLDATLDSTPKSNVKFNSGMYSGFDQYNQNVGLDTPLDKIYYELDKVSRNPADPHWGGKDYTKNAINKGDYVGRYVYKYKHVQ